MIYLVFAKFTKYLKGLLEKAVESTSFKKLFQAHHASKTALVYLSSRDLEVRIIGGN